MHCLAHTVHRNMTKIVGPEVAFRRTQLELVKLSSDLGTFLGVASKLKKSKKLKSSTLIEDYKNQLYSSRHINFCIAIIPCVGKGPVARCCRAFADLNNLGPFRDFFLRMVLKLLFGSEPGNCACREDEKINSIETLQKKGFNM